MCMCCIHVCKCAPNMCRCVNGSIARGVVGREAPCRLVTTTKFIGRSASFCRAGLMMSFVLLCGLLTAESQRNRIKRKANGAEAVYESQVRQAQVRPPQLNIDQICVLFP